MSDPSRALPAGVRHLLFYDGDCALCSRTVRIVAAADREGRFAFAPLGGATAEREAAALRGEGSSTRSLLLLEDVGGAALLRRRSRAVLRTLWLLGPPWSIVGSLAFLPALPFDLLYRLVARTRYAVFGRVRACPLPPEGVRARFLP